MPKQKILLLGAGAFSKACIDVIEQQDVYTIAGILDDEARPETRIVGYHVLGNLSSLSQWSKKVKYALVCINNADYKARKALYDKLKKAGFKLPVIISPYAWVSPHAEINDGSIIFHKVMVNSGARIGSNCIINTRALIEFDAVIQSHCIIGSGSIINGGVCVGEGSFIASGNTTKQFCTIASGTVTGDNVITKD